MHGRDLASLQPQLNIGELPWDIQSVATPLAVINPENFSLALVARTLPTLSFVPLRRSCACLLWPPILP